MKPLRRRVNSGRMAEPFVYADSPIVDPGGSPLAGHLAPDGAVASDGGPRRLREALGAGFVGMYVGADPGEASRFVAQVLAAGEPVPVHPVVVLPPGVEGHRVPAGATLLRDAEGTLGAAYNPAGEAMWYLVRPDGHIAAARPGHAAGDLGGVLASWIGGRAIAGLAGSRRPEAVNHAGA